MRFEVYFEVDFPHKKTLLFKHDDLGDAELECRRFARNSVYGLTEFRDCYNMLCLEGRYGVAWFIVDSLATEEPTEGAKVLLFTRGNNGLND